MKSRHLAVAFVACVLAFSEVKAQRLAQWGDLDDSVMPAVPSATDIVTATQNFVAPSDYTTYVPGTVISPAQGENYYPNSANHTPSFNGAFSEVPSNRAAVFQPNNEAGIDQIQVRTTTAATQFSGMIVFEDLLAETGSLLSFLTHRYRFDAGATGGRTRFVFQASDESWYASDPSAGLPGNLGGQFLGQAATQSWYDFTPFVSGVATFGTELAEPNFEQPQAVGLYFEVDKSADSQAGFSMGFFRAVVTGGNQPGDFNGDGRVDLADYTVWRDNFGADESVLPADTTNGSGVVDAGDYEVWKLNFGEPAAGAEVLAAVSVPEPSTAAVLVAVSLAVAVVVKRKVG